MSNIVRSNDDQKTKAVAPTDPFQRLMREMLRWDPFRELAPGAPTAETSTFAPPFEVRETKEAYLVKADLPGVQDKDLEVKLHGNRLVISGKRDAEHEDKSDAYYTYERSYGSFMRAFTLPNGIDGDHIQADLKDGVLTVSIPKTESAQAKTIAVKTGAKS